MFEADISEYVYKHTIENPSEIPFDEFQKLKCEVFADLRTPIYPDIVDKYMISTKGRFYNKETGNILRGHVNGKDKSGYWTIGLKCKIPGTNMCKKRYFGIHRLLMIIFCPVENMVKLQINHKDGNKQNLKSSNLEWATPAENIQHAYRTGLAKPLRGDDSPYSTITEEDVRKICEMYMSGKYKRREIANEMGVSKSLVSCILTTNGSWSHITKDYDFSMREIFRSPDKFDIPDIHMFCKYFVEHPIKDKQSTRNYIIQVLNDTGFSNNHEIDENMIYSVRNIYKRRYYKRISDKYED